MSRFKIIRDSPYKYKIKLFEFWAEYLPGTPSTRLDWMENNPNGPAIWLFALEEKTGILAGTISIMPKELLIDGKSIKAGILGDLMIHKKHRVFGPALDLLKNATATLDQEGFDVIYTIPNMGSKKILERVGFRPGVNLLSLMSPQRLDFLISKYVSLFWARILEIPLLAILKLISREEYVKYQCVIEEIDWKEELFSSFYQQMKLSHPGMMTGSYHLPYLKWRYYENPVLDLKVFTIRQSVGEEIQGFFVVSLNNQRVELYDIVGIEDKVVFAIIKQIKKISKVNSCRGVYCMVSETNPILYVLKQCNFFDTKDKAEIYFYPNMPKEMERWYFTSADRNI